MSVCSLQGETGVAGAPGPPGIAGLKVNKWGCPIFASVQWLASVWFWLRPKCYSCSVKWAYIVFWAIALRLSLISCGEEDGGARGEEEVGRRVVVLRSLGWIGCWWERTDAGWGQTGKLLLAELSAALKEMDEMSSKVKPWTFPCGRGAGGGGGSCHRQLLFLF